jgi:hypothetical protein
MRARREQLPGGLPAALFALAGLVALALLFIATGPA